MATALSAPVTSIYFDQKLLLCIAALEILFKIFMKLILSQKWKETLRHPVATSYIS